jgi:ribosomal protein S11
MPFTPPAMAVEGVAVDLAARAKAIHGAVGIGTQGRTTVAAARVITSEGGELILVGSSEGALRPAQRAMLQAGEQAVKGPGHAEIAVINAAQASGATVKEIAASRPICPKCNEVIKDIGAAILSLIK